MTSSCGEDSQSVIAEQDVIRASAPRLTQKLVDYWTPAANSRIRVRPDIDPITGKSTAGQLPGSTATIDAVVKSQLAASDVVVLAKGFGTTQTVTVPFSLGAAGSAQGGLVTTELHTALAVQCASGTTATSITLRRAHHSELRWPRPAAGEYVVVAGRLDSAGRLVPRVIGTWDATSKMLGIQRTKVSVATGIPSCP